MAAGIDICGRDRNLCLLGGCRVRQEANKETEAEAGRQGVPAAPYPYSLTLALKL